MSQPIPGSVTSVLELISAYNFNISYISSQENGIEYQLFKMGLIVDKQDRIKEFIEETRKSIMFENVTTDRK